MHFIISIIFIFKVNPLQDVVVELKNDLSICGTLHSVDQYLNIKVSSKKFNLDAKK